ncbi:YrhK family protein [Streptomyces sp. NRRL F-5126]|uniref:YrhK family protein n=1 Tax=Streptomyces sp. NRRL F-5126 TaxID=1463857 RepID=UPI0004C58172|nr:YrhK family protein [Streptomyces sp. NRRL F-5126]
MGNSTPQQPLTLHIGHDELVVRRRYEVASILNDILVALWFIVGSVMFFSENWTTTGTWCFLIGSVELLIRPVIRLTRHVHIRRIRESPATAGGPAAATGAVADSVQDY